MNYRFKFNAYPQGVYFEGCGDKDIQLATGKSVVCSISPKIENIQSEVLCFIVTSKIIKDDKIKLVINIYTDSYANNIYHLTKDEVSKTNMKLVLKSSRGAYDYSSFIKRFFSKKLNLSIPTLRYILKTILTMWFEIFGEIFDEIVISRVTGGSKNDYKRNLSLEHFYKHL